MIEIKPANTIEHYKVIKELAWKIMPDFYGPYIPQYHISFFLEKYQAVPAIEAQITNGFEYYLIHNSGNTAGYMAIQLNSTALLLSKLYMLEIYRGKGLGKIAMEFIIDRAKKIKAPKIELIVNRKNLRTIEFYKKWGFQITESQVNKFENGHSEEDYMMSLPIEKTL
jgi:ribosomal protein S18 acetylase RimI-like enzyme